MYTITKFPHLRVLAVEDHMAHPEILESMLMSFACDFDIVDNYFDALEMHTLHPYDVVIIDMVIFTAADRDIIQYLQHRLGIKSKVKTVVLCAPDREKDERLWLQAGATAVIKKPIKIQDLERSFLLLFPHKAHKCRSLVVG